MPGNGTEGQDIVTQKRGSSFSNSMQPFRYSDLSPMSLNLFEEFWSPPAIGIRKSTTAHHVIKAEVIHACSR